MTLPPDRAARPIATVSGPVSGTAIRAVAASQPASTSVSATGFLKRLWRAATAG